MKKKMKKWTRYLLWFAQEHIEFRIPEIESLVSLLKIDMRYNQKPANIEPFWIVEFKSDDDAILLANRSVSLKVIVELWGHEKCINKLHESLKKYPQHLIDQYFLPNNSFKIEVETFGRHFTQKEKVDKLESFAYLPIKSSVNLNQPDKRLKYIEYYGTNASTPPELPYDMFFGRCVATSVRQLVGSFSLKTRKFIGNTSMDPQLSLLMANQAQVKDGDLVLDAFVGSGSLLVAAAHFGGYVLGSDIDYLMLHGKNRPSRIKQKKREKDESIKANLEQYNLGHRYIDVLVNDFAMEFWKHSMLFDSIITDPPYGIRESIEKIGTIKEDYVVSETHLPTHIPAKIEYGIGLMYKDLLLFSAKHLTIGGRLVCWFPVFREDYSELNLPQHPCLKLIANSEQTLSKATSRRLLTYEKQRHPVGDELIMDHTDITDFKKKYYVVREETRKSRKTRNAQEKHKSWLKGKEENNSNLQTM